KFAASFGISGSAIRVRHAMMHPALCSAHLESRLAFRLFMPGAGDCVSGLVTPRCLRSRTASRGGPVDLLSTDKGREVEYFTCFRAKLDLIPSTLSIRVRKSLRKR